MLEGINYWDELRDSPSQMEICFAVFANVLELDDSGQPVNEKMQRRVLRRTSTGTAPASCHLANPTWSRGRRSCTDASIVPLACH
jgi:hypothetical protein